MNLFGEMADVPTFEAFCEWPAHVRMQYALLLAEVGTDPHIDRDVKLTNARRNLVPMAPLRRAIDLGCRPFALTYSDARADDSEPVFHPEVRGTRDKLSSRRADHG